LKYDIDLEHHLLYISFRNKHIHPEDPVSTQQLISRLMTEYPQVFQSSAKISYTIATLKTQGLIYEQQQLDAESYNKCIEETKQHHPRMGEQRIRKECLRKTGYKSVLMPTELGVIEFCSRVKPCITGRTTKTNTVILDVCKTYKVEGV
jgi:hypothetical protein